MGSAEIQECLSKAQAQSTIFPAVNWVDFYVDAYAVTREGNFEGKTILQKNMTILSWQAGINLPNLM